MKIFDKYDLTPINILKGLGILFLIALAIAILMQLFGKTFRISGNDINSTLSQGFGMAKFAESNMEMDMAYPATLSYRNIAPMDEPYNQDYIGDDAEAFEVSEYYSYIENRNLKKTCSQVSDLKLLSYVIFESANEQEKSCNYTFKVEKENVDEILSNIKDLNPKELSESIYTIKGQIDDYTSELDILEKRKTTMEDTLSKATTAYDEITELARQNKDAESLAKIIDSKLKTIERLTQEIVSINAQIERYERSKQLQLDRIKYTRFNVTIVEKKFIDFDQIKDTWFEATRSALQDINEAIQGISINLIAFLILIIQYSIYFFIVVLIAKLYWNWVKKIWTKKK